MSPCSLPQTQVILRTAHPSPLDSDILQHLGFKMRTELTFLEDCLEEGAMWSQSSTSGLCSSP